MSMISGPSLDVLERKLGRAREHGFVPYADVLDGYLRSDETIDRYRALADWYAEQSHFWVGDGPFYLEEVHPVERTVVLRRYEDFPDPADKWLRFTQPRIPEVGLDGPMMVQMGSGARFDLTITFQGEPYGRDAIKEVQYLLFDGEGDLVHRGQAETASEGRWRIALDPGQLDALGTGANSLEVAVTSTDVALPTFASHAFATVPPGTKALEETP